METIVCPHCETNLKLNSQIAPGRRVRCPKCSTAFVPETEEEHVEIFVDSPDAKETHRRRPAEEDTVQKSRREHPGRGTRHADDESDDDERPGRRRRREEEDDEGEDRPVRRKKRRKKAAGSGGTIVLTVALVMGGLVVLGGLGVGIYFAVHALADSYGKNEAAAKETISVLNELADALESVKDPPSARLAAARIEAVCDRMEQLATRIKGLPKLSPEDDKKLEQQFKAEITRINERIVKVAFQAGVNSKAEPAFMSAANRLKTVGEKLQQASKNK
jgi:predicted Zn finger-like uncharacterized protein